MQKEKLNRKNKGITLIALIITIIVMLILVGVSVTVALNGGLFSTAQDAADRYEAEKANEEKMATEEYIQGIIDSVGGSDEPIEPSEPDEPGYTLSGKWQFIDNIGPDDGKNEGLNISQEITFTVTATDPDTSFGVDLGTYTYNSITATQYEDGAVYWLYLYYDNENVYTGHDNWDGSSYDFDTLNFGTEPQTVSQEFYEWFTTNANQVEE